MLKIPGNVGIQVVSLFLMMMIIIIIHMVFFFQSTLMVYCIAFLNEVNLMITSLTMMTLIGSCVAYKYRQRGLTSCGLLRE